MAGCRSTVVTSELFFEVVEHAVAAAAIGDLVIGGGGLATASSTLANITFTYYFHNITQLSLAFQR